MFEQRCQPVNWLFQAWIDTVQTTECNFFLKRTAYTIFWKQMVKVLSNYLSFSLFSLPHILSLFIELFLCDSLFIPIFYPSLCFFLCNSLLFPLPLFPYILFIFIIFLSLLFPLPFSLFNFRQKTYLKVQRTIQIQNVNGQTY